MTPNLGDDVESVPDRRGAGLELVPPIALGDGVGSQRLRHVQRVGHRNHSRSVNLVHLFDECQNRGQLAGVPPNVIAREMQPRKVGDVRNAFGFERHLIVKSQELDLTS